MTPLLTWYGDDMTGSVDVLEALMRIGLQGALFIDTPAEAELERFADRPAVGIAGMTRTMPAAQIRAELTPVFGRLRALGAPVLHYKVCSTFDSSPDVGSIGAALELAEELLAPAFLPLLPAAPALGRYTAFATHFARSGSAAEVFRLDRHPTMRNHPVTPMREADLRLELARQTALRQGHVDLVAVGGGLASTRAALDAELSAHARVVLFDAVDDAHMATLGALLWERAAAAPLPVVGSAGVEHALTAHWRAAGVVPHAEPLAYGAAHDAIVAVAGSRSPVTDAQIAAAVAAGFAEVAPPLEAFLAGEEALLAHALPQLRAARAAGRSVLVHSAGGPIASSPPQRPLSPAQRRALGAALGAVADHALADGAVGRLAIAGGDTSGDVARRLGVVAVEGIAPFGPAMPLCRALAPGRPADGAELVFKGGQTGTVDFFDEVRRGRPHITQQEDER